MVILLTMLFSLQLIRCIILAKMKTYKVRILHYWLLYDSFVAFACLGMLKQQYDRNVALYGY